MLKFGYVSIPKDRSPQFTIFLLWAAAWGLEVLPPIKVGLGCLGKILQKVFSTSCFDLFKYSFLKTKFLGVLQ